MPKRHRARSTAGSRHVRLEHYILKSEAWRSLSPFSRCLYIELKLRYNGYNNGDIAMSQREAEAAIGCSNKPAQRALRDLQERGFIRIAQKGSFDWKTADTGESKSTRWILTEHPIDYPQPSVMPGTKEFMRWTPAERNSRGDEVPPMGVRHTPMPEPMRGRDTPIEGRRYPHEA